MIPASTSKIINVEASGTFFRYVC